LRATAVAEIEAYISEGRENFCWDYLCRWVDFPNGIYHFGSGKEMGGIGWRWGRGVSLLQCSNVNADVGYWGFGVIFFIAHILKNLN
jgi:hypothetical protein